MPAQWSLLEAKRTYHRRRENDVDDLTRTLRCAGQEVANKGEREPRGTGWCGATCAHGARPPARTTNVSDRSARSAGSFRCRASSTRNGSWRSRRTRSWPERPLPSFQLLPVVGHQIEELGDFPVEIVDVGRERAAG